MRAFRSQLLVSASVLLSLLACAGCAGDTAGSPPPTSAPDESAVAYECNGRPVDVARYDADVRADELTGDAAAALASVVDDLGTSVAPENLSEWVVTTESPTSITVLRPYDAIDDSGADHDVRVFENVGDLPATGEARWMLTSSASCALAIDPAPLTPAEVNLDRAALPVPDATELALLVTERACNSGMDAAGRVELIALEETEDAVIVQIAVRPDDDGAATCQSNPPTPFTVELDSPLGDREIMDGALIVPRLLDVLGSFGE
ncbi:hypothetical protein [Microbacterium sp. A84]|uniref:hypothetical protein n=1 Tax=Microbacterium sp. A84 TaxID=3450715 RepID=UPI003F41FD47